MKMLTIGLVGLVSAGLAVGNAFAFSCPSLVKAANEAIAKAEPMAMKATDEKQKARNMGMIEAAKDLTKQAEASHGRQARTLRGPGQGRQVPRRAGEVEPASSFALDPAPESTGGGVSRAPRGGHRSKHPSRRPPSSTAPSCASRHRRPGRRRR